MGTTCSSAQRIQINSTFIQSEKEQIKQEFSRKESVLQIAVIDGTPQTIHKQLYFCKKLQLEQKSHLIQEKGLMTALQCLPMLEKQFQSNNEEVTYHSQIKFKPPEKFYDIWNNICFNIAKLIIFTSFIWDLRKFFPHSISNKISSNLY
ncbi:hypothetical protein pb186bvf_002772 [Paramecium bursaria]